METTRRTAGLGLLAYGLGTAVAFMATGSPGGSYEESKVTAYMDSGNWPVVAALAYLGAFSALALLIFARGMREELGAVGDLFWALTIAAAATAVVGWVLVAGIPVAFGEGGSAVAAVPHPAVYLVSEMSNLVSVCASAFCLGTGAILLAAKADLPTSVRVTTYLAGGCGILAAFFFPLFLFWLWAIGTGAWMAVSRRDSARVVQAQLA
jgi:hypothetical protein